MQRPGSDIAAKNNKGMTPKQIEEDQKTSHEIMKSMNTKAGAQ